MEKVLHKATQLWTLESRKIKLFNNYFVFWGEGSGVGGRMLFKYAI